MTGISTASRTEEKQCRGHTAGMATTFAALDDDGVRAPGCNLDRVLRGTDRGHDDDAVVLELGDQFLLGSQRKRRDLDAFTDQQIRALRGVSGVGTHVDAERLVRELLRLLDRVLKLVVRHRGRSQDAETTGVSRCRRESGTGNPAHTRLHDRVLDTDQFGQRGLQGGGHAETSRSRRLRGSRVSRMR